MSYFSSLFCLSNLDSKQYEGMHATPVQCGVPPPPGLASWSLVAPLVAPLLRGRLLNY